MKKLYFTLAFAFFSMSLLAQGGIEKLASFTQNKTAVQLPPIATKSLQKSLVSEGFVPKAPTACVDTLFYTFYKQYFVDQTKMFYYPISDSSSVYGVKDSVAQVFKTGTTPFTLNGVGMYLAKNTGDVSTVAVNVAIYNVDASGAPTTLKTSTVYTIPDDVLNIKYITFPTPINISNDFAVVVSVQTPSKVARVAVSDDAYDATYDEQLSFINVPGLLNNLGNVYSLYMQYLGQQTDFDFLFFPMINYTADVPSFTVTPNPNCVNTNLTMTGTISPANSDNRFMNFYTFVDHFGFAPGVTPYAILTNSAGVGDTLLTNNATYAYTAAGSYVAEFNYDAGFVASCVASNTANVTINTVPDPTFSYTSTNYCQSDANETAQTATSGGTFSSTPAGLSINASTGEIDFSNSQPGNYSVTYIVSNGTCADTQTVAVNVSLSYDASFSYAQSAYCANDANNPTVQLSSGATAGTFTASDSGLSLNADGSINLAQSTPNTYVVTNTVGSGACADVKTASVTINTAPDASFSYPTNDFCVFGTGATPTMADNTGTFSSTTGLSVDPQSGVVNMLNSTVGTYVVTHEVSNANCTATATQSVTIHDLPTISFNLQSSICEYNDAIPLSATPAGGTFSGNGVTNNTFNPSGLANGNYTITYDYTDGFGCSNQSSQTINVSECLGLDEVESVQVKLFPVPATDLVTISSNSDVFAQIYSVEGKLIVPSFKIKATEDYQLNTASFARGIYLVKLSSNSSESIQRMILK